LRQLAAATPHTPTNPLGEVRQYAAFGDAYCALQQYRYKDAQHVLEPLHAELLALDSNLLAIRAGLALAIALQGQRQHVQALRSCREAMEMAADAGIIGSVLDQGPELGALLAALRANLDPGSPLLAFTQRVLDAWQALYGGMPGAAGTASAQGGAGGNAGGKGADARLTLGPRECGILELIAEGNSNKEVARLLGIGPETVKTHLKNIFVKLNVDRRIQAVAQAEALGLLKRRR
jgi:LuxR family maltose regulon positive regulatory protein